MICPFCHNEFKSIEICPVCNSSMFFMPGEGPHGTWECLFCSSKDNIVGYRTSITGLIKVTDIVGRYSIIKET